MSSSIQGFTILIVEDDERLAYTIREVLQQEGLSVLTAATSRRGHELLESSGVDAAVVDLKLPDGSGLDFIRQVANSAGAPAVIGISGQATIEATLQALRSGATDFLQKPFGAPDLVAAVRRAVERRRLASALEIHEKAANLLDAAGLSDLGQRAVALGMQLLPSDRVCLMLPPAGTRFVIVTAQGHDVLEEVAATTPDSVSSRVFASGEATLIQGPAAQDARFQGVSSSPRVGSSIVAPLRGEHITYALMTYSRAPGSKPFCASDLERARTLATQTVIGFVQLRSREHVASMERLAALGELMANVAHELNNPISFVHSNIAFALDAAQQLITGVQGTSLVELKDALVDANEGAERVVALVKDMKGLARTDEGHFELFEISKPIQSALRLAGADLASVKMNIDLPEGLVVRGNSGRLSQVFVNLFINAVHAIAGMADERKRVEVTGAVAGGEIVVSVQDSGAGISSDVAARVFEPFFTTKTAKGTGLGLPISRDIVRKHGGDLTLDEASEAGARFVVRLPRA